MWSVGREHGHVALNRAIQKDRNGLTLAVAPRDVRRLAAILMADVVGYSALVEIDEVGTLDAMKSLRREVITPLIAQFSGRVIQITGDGTLVEFMSVVDAVACAIALQAGIAAHERPRPLACRLQMRIGVNLGDVVLDGDELQGDGVNVAARLEQLCPTGGILISGTAYDQLHGKLDRPIDFAGEQRLKSLSRPVRTYLVRLDPNMRPEPPAERRARRWAAWTCVTVLAITLSLLAGVSVLWQPRDKPGHTGPELASAQVSRPVLAVLPLDDMSDDESTRRLAGGLTEDIITDMSRFQNLDVIARSSSAVFAGKPIDIRKVGKALGAGYVLEGSIQRGADRVRVTAQLIDAGTGAHLWAERWDRPTADVFNVQSEIAAAVAAKLGGYTGAIQAGELGRARRKRPENLAAYDLYLLGVEANNEASVPSILRARSLLDRAIALDPQFARTYVARAWTSTMLRSRIEAPHERVSLLRQLQDDTAKAVALDPVDAEARLALGVAHAAVGELRPAEVEFERALELNPSSVLVLADFAMVAATFDKAEFGAELADRARRLDSHPPAWAYGNYGHAYFMVSRFADAIAMGERMPRQSWTRSAHVRFAGSLAMLGRTAEAKQAVAEALRLFPNLSYETHAYANASLSIHEKHQYERTMRAAGFRTCAPVEARATLPEAKQLPDCKLL